MRFDPHQLETLLSIVELGTFDAAARHLHLTPSAVSQRIRALESAAGQVLVRRTTPCEATAAGAELVRLAGQLRLLQEEAAAAVVVDGGVVDLAVAVNADSLATWFRPVLADAASREGVALRLFVEDQGHSHDLLRRGEVLAAVSDEPTPVQGCTAEALGRLRYRPAATPELIERHRRGRGVDWPRLPMVVFNEKDRLQDEALAARGIGRPRVVHRVPSTADFHAAVRAGLGWAMIPEPHLEPDVAAGVLAPLPGGAAVDVPLHWQRWRFASAALDALSADVRRAASTLRRP